ncbi:hypothetical protein BN1708_002558 [Verticillium longisporum]|uniref:Uncharacterized protein n=1 Tax=Verticillium longisporum TaxID=100787 RepID=A0A0G4KTY0_VERLO|nr:hypothetical protein BN1708_002558 [Verticillium longisporum]
MLAYAAGMGSLNVLKLLIEGGADVNRPLRTGRYSSVLAAALLAPRFNDETIEWLIGEAKADLSLLKSSPPQQPPWAAWFEWLSDGSQLRMQREGFWIMKRLAGARLIPLQSMLDVGYPAVLVAEVERLRLTHGEDN